MFRPANALAMLCAALLGTVGSINAQAASITQHASIPLSATDFNTSNSNIAGKDPLVLQKFDTVGGSRVLDSVSLTFNAMVRSDFSMVFTTPSTITDSVATGSAAHPGPTITLYQPDGKTPILTVNAPNDPSVLSRVQTYGHNAGEKLPQEFASSLSSSSPFYLAPAVFQKSSSQSLTARAALTEFTGTGTVDLPVVATAFATISTSSGNGRGSVTTAGSADATVTYSYHNVTPQPQTLPEPGSLLLWGGGAAGIALCALRRRLARVS